MQADHLQHLWDYPNPFIVSTTVKAEHIDGLGHTNNVHYLEWLQNCAWQHSKAVGFANKDMLAINRAMAVRETRMTYLAATHANDVLFIADWITQNDGRLRATRSFQILRQADQVCVMRAEIDYICINIATGRPQRMPQSFVEAFCVISDS